MQFELALNTSATILFAFVATDKSRFSHKYVTFTEAFNGQISKTD